MTGFGAHPVELVEAVEGVVGIVAELRRILARCVRELCETGDLPWEEAERLLRLLGEPGPDFAAPAAAEEAEREGSPAQPTHDMEEHATEDVRRKRERGARKNAGVSGEEPAGS